MVHKGLRGYRVLRGKLEHRALPGSKERKAYKVYKAYRAIRGLQDYRV
jgi:hypothetical protein